MNPLAVSPLAPSDAIVQQVTIKAPAARIFDALTDPHQLLQWWRIDDRFRLIHAECDLRSGGKWLMRVIGPCSEDRPESIVHGVYLTVDRPHCLAFTWIRDEDDHPETIVRWDLEEQGDVTLVRVTHSGLVTERLRQRNSGWTHIVQLLQAYTEN
jgi:uncharacterized protein YndB with AHSA1/START domain